MNTFARVSFPCFAYLFLPASPRFDPMPSLAKPETRQGRFQRLLSACRSQITEVETGPPPDGGLVAWSQVLGAHLLVCNTWGFVSAFGAFQAYYADFLGKPASSISWIGSIQVFLLFFVGTFSGRAADAGYFRLTWGVGGVLTLIGIFASSACTAYWQLFLSQGVCMGLGFGLMFCPVVSLIPTYFSRHRCLAVGLSGAGSATGGLIFPAVVGRLLPIVGFPWTMRTLGFMTLAMLVPSWFLLKQRIPPRKSGPLVEWAAFADVTYTLFAVGMFLNFWGVYIAFFYVGTFAKSNVGMSSGQATDLLMVMNGVGFLARVIPSFAADRYTGPMNMLISSALLSAVLLLGWIGVAEASTLYVFVVLYGTFAASTQSMFPATLASISTNLDTLGTRLGMVLTIVSFASLTGPPIAGALLAEAKGDYIFLQLFAGLCMMAGAATLVAGRLYKYGFVLRVKA